MWRNKCNIRFKWLSKKGIGKNKFLAHSTAMISLEDGMNKLYDFVVDSPLKVMARRVGAKHREMLSSADGYVTAWFMWHLQWNEEASKAFAGYNAEILGNKLYQDQRILINNN